MRQQLEAGARQGRVHPDLLLPPPPPVLQHVIDWFDELQSERASSGFGLSPISYQQIGEWARLTGRDPSPFEVRLLKDLDLARRAELACRAADQGKTE